MSDTGPPRGLAAALSSEPDAVRRRLDVMETMLEGMFTVPGLNRRVGLDAVIGLVPVVGDLAGAVMGSYLIWEARNLGLSKWAMARMFGRVGLDTALGAVPLVGDLFDFAYRSNSRNLRAIRRHLDRHHPSGATLEG